MLLKYQTLTLETFDRISSGHRLGSAVPVLLSGEYSRRLLLLKHIVDTTRDRPDLFEPGPAPEIGWGVLQTAQSRSAATVRDLICHPTSGLWAAHTTRRLASVATDDTPLWVHLAHLSSIAASAAVILELDVDLRIPVRRGMALLPLVGHTQLPTDAEWTLANVRTLGGAAWLSLALDDDQATDDDRAHDDHAATPVRIGTADSGWTPARILRSDVDGQTVTASLEITDPYPGLFGLRPSARALDRDDTVWGRVLNEAWTLLVRDHSEQADGLTAGLRSIIPLDSHDPAAPASGSAADAFGAAALRRTTDPVELAVALVHEFQHSVLNGLLHLVPLVDDDDRLFYAPWRDDPRPLTSLLHGAYAFSAVTRFWRTHRARAGPNAEVAQFEFALWRSRTDTVLTTLTDAGGLTELGQRFVDRLRSEIDPWLEEAVPEHLSRAAGWAAQAHYAAWRVHHLHPDPNWVSRAAAGWRQNTAANPGSTPAPPTVAAPPPALRADRSVPYLDHIARLYRDTLSVRPARSTRRGASAAEVALVAGEPERARLLYLQDIFRDDRPTAWGGLGLALVMTGDDPGVAETTPGAHALITRPESVRALHLALRTENEPPSVVDLARWLH